MHALHRQTAAAALAAKLLPNGTWPDIDYHDFRRADWPMTAHLARVVQISAAWRGGNASLPPTGGAAQVRAR